MKNCHMLCILNTTIQHRILDNEPRVRKWKRGYVNLDTQKNMHYFMETKTITYKGTRETGNETKQMKEMKKKWKTYF